MYEIRHSNIQGQRNYGNSLLFNFEGLWTFKQALIDYCVYIAQTDFS